MPPPPNALRTASAAGVDRGRAAAPAGSLAGLLGGALAPGRGDLGLMAAVLVPGLLVLVALALACLSSGEHPGVFTRDPLAVARGHHPLTGFLSNLGAVLWSAGAAVPLFAWGVVRASGRQGSERAGAFQGALLGGGLLTVLLLLDDLFMLHEALYPSLMGLEEGGEVAVLALYGLALATYLARCREVLLATRPFLLLVSLGLFALSVGVDQLPVGTLPGQVLVEDGFKFLGIGTWMVFQGAVAAAALRARDGAESGS